MSFESFSLVFDTSHMGSTKGMAPEVTLFIEYIRKINSFSDSENLDTSHVASKDDLSKIRNFALFGELDADDFMFEDSDEYLDEVDLDEMGLDDTEACYLYTAAINNFITNNYESVGDILMLNSDCAELSATFRYYQHNFSDTLPYVCCITWTRQGTQIKKEIWREEPEDPDQIWTIKPDNKKSPT